MDLDAYPANQVLGALTRCRREVKGRLTLADVITRLDDGRPGAEEAWSMIPRDEYRSVIWTREMARAFGIAQPLIADGDLIAARMAFKETYTAACQRARDSGELVKWTPSYGFDKSGRAKAINDAVERKLLTRQEGQAMIEHVAPEYVDGSDRALTGPVSVSTLLSKLSEDLESA